MSRAPLTPDELPAHPPVAHVPTRGARARLVAGVAVVVLAATAVAVGVSRAPAPSPAPAISVGPGPAASLSSGASPSAVPADAWARIDLPPFQPVADLDATRADGAAIARDSAFVLSSRNGEPAAAQAARLTVSPPIGLTLVPSTDPARATIRPAEALQPGAVYRFTLAAPSGQVQGGWAFQVAAPLRVVGTLPGDRSTGVPVTTGIEITFDQDGATGADRFFSIDPSVPGRFETHGRTLAFVPAALQPATVYTVTVRRGVPIAGSDQVLAGDVTFAFETAGAGTRQALTLDFNRHVYETSTRDPAVMQGWMRGDHARLPVQVFRFPTMRACLDALTAVEKTPSWADRAGSLVPTAGLTRVASFTAAPASVDPDWGDVVWFRFPAALPAGWYLVNAGSDAATSQAFLQVTDASVYLAASSTRTVAWVHDLASGAAMAGASVAVDGGAALGTTDGQGLLAVDTPEALLVDGRPWDSSWVPPPAVIVRAPDGRTAFVAGGGQGGSYVAGEQDAYWQLLYTDRYEYRSSDTVNAWGYVRSRDGGEVPTTLDVRLVSSASGDPGQPPIQATTVRPAASGAFAASLAWSGLPLGSYRIEVLSNGQQIAQRWFEVGVITKPAYELTVTTDRHVYLEGEPVRISVRATYYDGTPVPGVALTMDGAKVTTGTDGSATVDRRATLPDSRGPWSEQWFDAAPSAPEEGAISGDTSVLVLASGLVLDGRASLDGSTLAATGTAHLADLAGLERTFVPGRWDLWDPRGAAAAGIRVSARVDQLVPVRTLIGQAYDFIAKQVVNDYEYSTRTQHVTSVSLTSAADGTFALRVTVPDPAATYQVTFTATDTGGRLAEETATTYRLAPQSSPTRVFLEAVDPRRAASPRHGGTSCGPPWGTAAYRVGDTVRVAMRDGRGILPDGRDAYLFLVEQRVIRRAVVQSSPLLAFPFDGSSPPDVTVSAVRFTGASLQDLTDGFVATFDTAQRSLAVTLTPDRSLYGPGDQVTLRVHTGSADGRPVPATVTLSAVDQKLFDIGAAEVADPLGDLYESVGSGLALSYASHAVPAIAQQVGCGSTAGGGTRSDFRDSVLFRQVTTDSAGSATVTFELSDDLTAWRVSAGATTADLQAGSASVRIPVGLPFFVDATLAPEYLAADRPELRLRAYGNELHQGDAITFTVSAPALGMAPTTFSGTAFVPASIALPPLAEGTHELTIRARATAGPDRLSDALVRTIHVIGSRLSRQRTDYQALTGSWSPQGGQGLTTYVFSDAGRGRLLPVLQSLAWGDGPRLDQALAADVARSLLASAFPAVAGTAPTTSFDVSPYVAPQDGGLALLPYASSDLELTVRAALADPAGLGHAQQAYLSAIYGDTQETAERRDIALAGLAAFGDPVLRDIQAAAADPARTTRQQLYLALGAAALGDEATARTIERNLLSAYGERFGPWIRLRVDGSAPDVLEATALLALVAAAVGDPLAAAAEAFVEATPSAEVLTSLQQAMYVQRSIAHLPATAAAVAYEVGGTRQVRQLGAGESFALTLTAAQRASFRAETIQGDVAVTTSWSEPFSSSAGTGSASGLSVRRNVVPAGEVRADQVVRVTFSVGLGALVSSGCYTLTETVPSGLVPIASGWYPDVASGEHAEMPYVPPYAIQGQTLRFCVSAGDCYPPGYLARVVSVGTYAWEPAVLQSGVEAADMAVSPPVTLTIR